MDDEDADGVTYQVCVFLTGEEDSGRVFDGGISLTLCCAGEINLHLVS